MFKSKLEMPRRSTRKTRRSRKTRQQRGGVAPLGLSGMLPVTNWGRWSDFPQSYQWGPNTSAPAALANGGLYTNPQSTGPWASSPFPATQYAFAVEGSKVSGLPEVAYHQRPNDNYGASYSPITGTPITSNHWSASGPAGPFIGGGRRRKTNRRRL